MTAVIGLMIAENIATMTKVSGKLKVGDYVTLLE